MDFTKLVNLSTINSGPSGKCWSFKHLLVHIWGFNGIYINPDNVNVTYNDLYKFLDVKVSRGPLYLTGHGSKEHQLQHWETIKEAVRVLHEITPDSEHYWDTFSLEPLDEEIHYIDEGVHSETTYISCPAFRFWILV